jgi:MFS family permease
MRHHRRVPVRPRLSLGLLSAQHALIHAQTALMPLVFVQVIAAWHVGVDQVGLLLAVANALGGGLQLAWGALSRVVPRPLILGGGGLTFGLGMSAAAATSSWIPFSAATVVGRLGGSPQHTVGHALLAEQFGPARQTFAISTHIALGNLGTVAIPLVGGWLIATGGWQAAVLALGLPALVVGAAIAGLVREAGTDRDAAIEHGGTISTLRSLRREPELIRLFVASSVAAAGRGLGILTTFVPLYLALVLGLDTGTVALMYTLLLAGSVPAPIVAGWLAERVGHRPVLVGSYVLAAASLALFVAAGHEIPIVWVALGFMSAFVFEESSLLQAMLAEVARPAIRDVAFSAYFTLMFAVGAVWAAVLGAIVGASGNAAGFPICFGLMAASYLVAAAVVPTPRPSAVRGQS